MARWMVGIDTGGTFTDLIAFESETSETRVLKVASVPSDPSVAVINALKELFATGVQPGEVGFFVHGTTAGTNALLEGKGVRTGLLITEGFRAVYEAGSAKRPDPVKLLDPAYTKPPMLVPQWLTEEVRERLDYTGAVITPLEDQQVRQAVRRLRDNEVKAIAVCLLFSFQNADHEERVADVIAAEAPDVRVSLSSRVLPVIREYPRLSTTVVDAYVGPIMETYLSRLVHRLRDVGVTTNQVFLMQSNGGFMRINLGARFPNQTLFSGPAAGVVSGQEIAATSGHRYLITFDMGGTSADISLVIDGHVGETSSGQIAGQDVATPMVSVHTLGTGGGTIAWIGKDGLLKVGPHSAGAVPGPACYGGGGREPTVTDAHVVLGALSGDSRLGGRIKVDKRLAEQAVKTVADPLGLDVVTAAAGIIKVINAHMAIDLRAVFQREGQDPRRYALVAFGGAGPLHAGALARELHVPSVLVPPHPGMTSAMGLLLTNVKHVYVQSSVGLLSAFAPDRMNALFGALRERATADVRDEGLDPKDMTLIRQVDLRYRHQGYELAVACPSEEITEADKATLKRRFDEDHLRIYGVNAADEDAEIVTLRVICEVTVPRLRLPDKRKGDGDVARAVRGKRPVFDFDSAAFVDALIYNREKLFPGDSFAGPAIVEQFDSTTILERGQSASVDGQSNLLIKTGA
ncbi:MAG: hydantoinase/oxoprolinase family protein [Alphaproteobacteria bacterium]|nr:hydantoinase/oxoprolinase family protein [Alphaproteobacteria bacterium]